MSFSCARTTFAGAVDDHALTRAILESPNLRMVCERLVEEAIEASGHDNITVIVAESRARCVSRLPSAGVTTEDRLRQLEVRREVDSGAAWDEVLRKAQLPPPTPFCSGSESQDEVERDLIQLATIETLEVVATPVDLRNQREAGPESVLGRGREEDRMISSNRTELYRSVGKRQSCRSVEVKVRFGGRPAM